MKLFFSHTRCDQKGILVLGTFDGVHIGHQQLLIKGRELAQKYRGPLIFSTFYPHPLKLICPERVPKTLTTVIERVSLLSLLEVDETVIWRFTKQMRDLSAKDFVEKVIMPLNPQGIVIGFNYTFGKNGAGTAEKMKEYGKAYGFFVEEVAPVVEDGQVVSSTRIRDFLAIGKVEEAAELLSRPYSIQGMIIHSLKAGGGPGLARTIMLPPKEKILPALGVYIGQVQTRKGFYPAVVGVGGQSLPSQEATIEAHLLNHNIDLTGEKVRVHFLHLIRPETAFSSAAAMEKQTAEDIRQAKQYFAQKNPLI